MAYASAVLFSPYIKTVAISLLLTGVGTSALHAASLTPKEHNVCPSLRTCIDIIRRHDASEFDYSVLEGQFRNFGPKGRAALFDVLTSKAGNADIAQMITATGALTGVERNRIQADWSLETASTYLPLLLDGNPLSKDLLLLTLGSDQASTREQARQGLLRLPKGIEGRAISQAVKAPLLSALARDPIAEAAPFLGRLPVGDDMHKFAALLRSGETSIVSASYTAMYRNNPSTAFSLLLGEMGKLNRPNQARAIGEMLLQRHAGRKDGFYLKFSRDISGDKTRPVSARASGLHAIMIAGDGGMPEFTAERAEALAFLIRSEPVVTQTQYISYLKQAKAEQELNLIWRIAQEEKWINRDNIAQAFIGGKLEDQIIADLIKSSDYRSVLAGVKHAKPFHQNLIQVAANHPIQAVSDIARQKLGISRRGAPKTPCLISTFDAQDNLNQMPFFDTAWTTQPNNERIQLERKSLTTAHPTKTGWVAGYDLPHRKAAHSSGALVYFSNKTGASHEIGDFSGPINILPNRPLKLGETTEQFWVLDRWSEDASGVSAYVVTLNGLNPNVRHLGAFPSSAHGFTVAPNGHLLMRFEDKNQSPIRLTQSGDIFLACSPRRPSNRMPAPN